MSSTYNTDTDTDAARQLRLAATVVGATFLLVGILGFVPGITTSYDDLSFAGHESEAEQETKKRGRREEAPAEPLYTPAVLRAAP